MFGLKKADGNVVDMETAYEFMDVLQNELVYLHSTNKNLNKREKELKEQIGNLTENKFNTSVTNKIVAKAAGVSEKDFYFTFFIVEEISKDLFKGVKTLINSNIPHFPLHYIVGLYDKIQYFLFFLQLLSV